MIHALIADDEAPALEKLKRWLLEQHDIEVVGEAADGLAATSKIIELTPQVVFLDIQMPGLTGLEVAAQLETDCAPLIVFVTAFDAYAIKAFDLNAIDYLLKPYDKSRFLKSLERVRARIAQTDSGAHAISAIRTQIGASQRLIIPQNSGVMLLDTEQISWLQANDNYVQVHTVQTSYRVRRTLRDVISQLGARRFIRIHKSVAVNLTQVHALNPIGNGDYEVALHSGARLRMSRRYKDELFQLLSAKTT